MPTYGDLGSNTVGTVSIRGRFAPQGVGTPTVTFGKGFTVARTGVGVFTVTIPKPMLGTLAGWRLDVRTVTLIDVEVQGGTWVASTGVFTIRTRTSTTNAAADIAANADNEVSFALIFARP